MGKRALGSTGIEAGVIGLGSWQLGNTVARVAHRAAGLIAGINEQGAQMDDLLPHVLAILSTTPQRWNTLAHAVPSDLLDRKPKRGEWSALDCLRHLVTTEREVFPVRLAAFRAGRDFAAYDPDAAGAVEGADDPDELVAEFETLRGRSLQDVAPLSPDDLRRTARHAELGQVTLGEMLSEWAGHDLMHTVQGERAMMQPFIAGSGPWRSYFTDHDAQPPGSEV